MSSGTDQTDGQAAPLLSDGKDTLDGADLVAAIYVEEISFQLGLLYESKQINRAWSGASDSTGARMDGLIRPPFLRIQFDPDYSISHAQLTFTFFSGTFTYKEDGEERTLPIGDWQCTFRVEFNFEDHDWEQVKAGETKLTSHAAKTSLNDFISKSSVADSDFVVRSLFLDQKTAYDPDIDSVKGGTLDYNPDLKQTFADLLLATITSEADTVDASAKSNFLLGYGLQIKNAEFHGSVLQPERCVPAFVGSKRGIACSTVDFCMLLQGNDVVGKWYPSPDSLVSWPDHDISGVFAIDYQRVFAPKVMAFIVDAIGDAITDCFEKVEEKNEDNKRYYEADFGTVESVKSTSRRGFGELAQVSTYSWETGNNPWSLLYTLDGVTDAVNIQDTIQYGQTLVMPVTVTIDTNAVVRIVIPYEIDFSVTEVESTPVTSRPLTGSGWISTDPSRGGTPLTLTGQLQTGAYGHLTLQFDMDPAVETKKDIDNPRLKREIADTFRVARTSSDAITASFETVPAQLRDKINERLASMSRANVVLPFGGTFAFDNLRFFNSTESDGPNCIVVNMIYAPAG